jgi:REP element-mobilizing transposase RayT
MPYNPQKHHRKSIRLKGYDYSRAGAYFVTICTKDRRHLLGKIVTGEMVLSPAGEMVEQIWNEIPENYSDVDIDFSVVMPNHFHGIIILKDNDCVGAPLVGAQSIVSESAQSIVSESAQSIVSESTQDERAGTRPAPTKAYTLSEIIGEFKSITTHEYTIGVKTKNWHRFNKKFWQPKFYDHIIRNEWDLNRIRKYIYYNPLKWEYDRENQNEIPLKEKKKFWKEFLKP